MFLIFFKRFCEEMENKSFFTLSSSFIALILHSFYVLSDFCQKVKNGQEVSDN